MRHEAMLRSLVDQDLATIERLSPTQRDFTPEIAPDRMSLIQQRNIYPLNSPGLPIVGSDMLAFAASLGDTTEVGKVKEKVGKKTKTKDAYTRIGQALHSVVRYMTYHSCYFPVVADLAKPAIGRSLPGLRWGATDPKMYGPRPADVMIIGKFPAQDESLKSRIFTGPSSVLFLDTLKRIVKERCPSGVFPYPLARWYVTNLLKVPHPRPKETLKKVWLNSFTPILFQELLLVRPKYILCLGPESTKVLLGNWANVTKMQGRAEQIELPYFENGELKTFTSTVMASPHPAAIYNDATEKYRLETTLRFFVDLLLDKATVSIGSNVESIETDVEHQIIDNEKDLVAWMKRMDHEKRKMFAVDAEWHGRHVENPGSYLRMVQIAWEPKKAVCVRLTLPGGKPGYQSCSGKSALERLSQLLCRQGIRIGGQFLTSDLEQLAPRGLDLLPNYRVPEGSKDGMPPWERTRTEGGFDSGIAAHAISETQSLGLEELAMRYLGLHRYQAKLEEWKSKHEKDCKDGYGLVPCEILEPYACFDADVVLRLMQLFDGMLDSDEFGNSVRKPYWMAMRAMPSIYEMTRTGLLVDRARLDNFYDLFSACHTELVDQIRRMLNWPEFNPSSVIHVREALYGSMHNGAKPKPGEPKRKRPKGAKSLLLPPLFTSGKIAKAWEEVIEEDAEDEHDPGTSNHILQILYHESDKKKAEVVGKIRDSRYIGKTITSFVRAPIPESEQDREAKRKKKIKAIDFCEPLKNDEGFYIYEDGLGGVIDSDGRIRTHLLPTTDSGRWRSFSPNLQNLAGTREKDYRRAIEEVLGEGTYGYGMRSMFRASPGHVLVASDYAGAELFAEAVFSGDRLMLEHVLREDYDIHSNVAVLAFRLSCEPTKLGLESIGKLYLRNLAKNIAFGRLYGRGAKAISIAAREEGVNISETETMKVMDTIAELYPEAERFLIECARRVTEPRWMCGQFGRYRRFPKVHTEKDRKDLERVAKNFPPQNFVADAINTAVYNLDRYRRSMKDPDSYRMVLAIHDEIVLEVKEECLEEVLHEVIPTCMSKQVPIYRRDLDGNFLSGKRYEMVIESSVYRYWKQKLTEAEKRELKLQL